MCNNPTPYLKMETGEISMVYTELKNWLTDWSFNIIISRKWVREGFFNDIPLG